MDLAFSHPRLPASSLPCLLASSPPRQFLLLASSFPSPPRFLASSLPSFLTCSRVVAPRLLFIRTMASMLGPETGPELNNVMEAVKNARTAKATERVPELGPETFFAYGCSEADGCGIHPLHANHWYRLSSASGANACYSNGSWACAHCSKRHISNTLGTNAFFFTRRRNEIRIGKTENDST